MSGVIQQLLALEPAIRVHFAEGRPDYHGTPITPAHVLRYLYTDLYRIQEVAEIVIRHSSPGENILDIGMGYGFYDMVLARHYDRVVRGLELTENIPVYSGLARDMGVEVIEGGLTAQGLPLPDASVDFVILSEVLEHLRIGPALALREIGRVLRPGGHLLVTTPNIARLINVMHLLAGRNIIERLPDEGADLDHITDAWQHIREYTMGELTDLLARSGFDVTEARHSRCWDRYNPHLLRGAGLMRRAAHLGLAVATWALPPLRSDLMVLATKPPVGAGRAHGVQTRQRQAEPPPSSAAPAERAEPLPLRDLLRMAGPIWVARLAWRRALRTWRRLTAPVHPLMGGGGRGTLQGSERPPRRRRAGLRAKMPAASPAFFVDSGSVQERVALLDRYLPEARARTIAAAEEVLCHRFDLLGSGPVDLGAEIDWHSDFKTGWRWPLVHHLRLTHPPLASPHDIKVPWELSRCHHLVTLGRAYAFSGDERCAREFVDQVRGWIAANPVEFGVNWAGPMDAAIRAVNWLWAYHLLDGSPALSAAFRAEFEQSMFEHGWYLLRNQELWWPPTNHLIADLAGLAYLGILFPQFEEASRWRERGLRGLGQELLAQVRPDGFADEASTSYHRLITELALSSILLARLNDIPIPADVLARLERMLEVIQSYTRPDGLDPFIGDADDGRLHVLSSMGDAVHTARDARHLLALGAVLFDRHDFAAAAGDCWEDAIWFFGGRVEPYLSAAYERSLTPSSACLRESGLAIMRHEDLYLSIDAGDIGHRGIGGHAHNDTLSITLSIGGTAFLVDPGAYVYTANVHLRNYFRSTASHNTLQVDGQEINRLVGGDIFRMQHDARPVIERWESTPEVDLLQAAHDGYRRLPGAVIHRRLVLFDKLGALWAVCDLVEGAGSHDLDWYFHFGRVDVAIVDELELVAVGAQETRLLILPLEPDGMTLCLYDGWVSPRYGVRYPAPAARFSRRRAVLPLRQVFLLQGVRPGTPVDRAGALARGDVLLSRLARP
ncbi:MAG: hypothetical protein Kow00124_22090 [Anaerolineae bacterium]